MTEQVRPHEGYGKLSKFIGKSPEHAVFHGFTTLYAENLLYLQAEIVHLQSELREAQNDDRSREGFRGTQHRDWGQLRSSSSPGPDGEDGRHLATIIALRKVLNEYYQSLLLYKQILKLKHPHLSTLRSMFSWMIRDSGNVFLNSPDWEIFKNQDPNVMISLEQDSDTFTLWVQTRLALVYHLVVGRHVNKPDDEENLGREISYSNERIERLTRALTVIIACVLPISSIFVLYFVRDMTKRLVLISLFTVLFVFSMSFTTSAKVHDIFSATATFAALQVVFVSTTG